MIKILALVFPALLFIFKYILPSLAEAALTNTDFLKKQAKVELIHFPVDLLFVAISYTIPQIIEIRYRILAIEETKAIDTEQYLIAYNQLSSSFNRYFILSIFILFLIPFYVFITKLTEKYYFGKKMEKMYLTIIPSYILVFFLIWLSLFY